MQTLKKLRLSACIFLSLSGSAFYTAVSAQTNAPNNNNAPASATVTLPGLQNAYPSNTPVNYVRTWQPLKPYTAEADVISSSRMVEEVNRATQYIDGLGRPLQTVGWQAAPGKLDIVAPVVYDEFGREKYKYLPYTSGNTGGFNTDPFAAAIYSPSSSDASALKNLYPGESVFYSQTDYEASPLSRVEKTMAPGNSWAGSNLGTRAQYLVNTVDDKVRSWTIGFVTPIGDAVNIPATASAYDAGQLYKNVAIDERGYQTVEYKDKEGRVVLKKVQIDASPSAEHVGWLCTYYIYDDLGQLRFVIPPKAVNIWRDASWNLTGTVLSDVVSGLCFRYEYDSRGRMIAKKVPGAGWMYMVYDKRDRVVFTQDANMRAKNWWMTTLYDDLNRPVQTAMLTGYTDTRANLQLFADGLSFTSPSAVSGTVTSVNTTVPDLYINIWQSGINYQAGNSITFQEGFESGTSAAFTADINTASGTAVTTTQQLSGYGVPTGGTLIPLTYTYYDDYSWGTAKLYSAANNSKLGIGANVYGEPLPATNSTLTRGLVTGTRVRVIEDAGNLALGKWLETVSFYDDKGRKIQVASDNYKGGPDVLTNRYDFAGKVISSYLVHNNSSAATTNLRVYTETDYDHAGRVTQVRKTLNDDASTRRIIAYNEYDRLGRLQRKKLGQKTDAYNQPVAISTPAGDVANWLEMQDYAYNIRGWLKGINWNGYNDGAGAKTQAISDRWFAMDLSYDWGYAQNQYNGNIAGMRWRTGGDLQERSYGYGYDGANRLLFGDFNQSYTSGWAKNQGIDFTTLMGNGVADGKAYDENGNIKKMSHMGIKGTGSEQIDVLKYTYTDNSNRLKNVADGKNDATTRLGDFRVSANHPLAATKAAYNGTNDDLSLSSVTDYTYDDNGNLVKDLNKDLGRDVAGSNGTTPGIIYNHLNLPYQVKVYTAANVEKGTITYIYDALGNKLEKRVDESAASTGNVSKMTVTSYLAGQVYENGVLQFLGHEEGRIRPRRELVSNNVIGYCYDYFLKDHLGNTRMVLTDEQQMLYYPAATMEGDITNSASAVHVENDYYTIDDVTKIVASPLPSTISYTNGDNGIDNPNPNSQASANSTQMYKLAGTGSNTTGLGITLKVMAGDYINIFGDSYWSGTGVSNTHSIDAITLITGLLGGSSGVGASHGVTAGGVQNIGSNLGDINGFLGGQSPGTAPRAYINYVFFDEQFRYVGGNFSPVGGSGVFKRHHLEDATRLQNIKVPKNGYVYVYCSNESNTPVFFDNLQVAFRRGPLMEETHYYPFGLTMAGISSKAAGELQNRFRYNGKELQNEEFSDGSGLELYDYEARYYDSQIGKWFVVDPLSEQSKRCSPYSYAYNNPVRFIDPDGMFPGDVVGKGSFEVCIGCKLKPVNMDGESGQQNWPSFKDIDENADFNRNKSDRELPNYIGKDGDDKNKRKKTNSNSVMAGTLILAGGSSELPPVAAAVLIAGATLATGYFIHEHWDGIVDNTSKMATAVSGMISWLFTKGGNQNIWPDEFPKPDPRKIDWRKTDEQLVDEVAGAGAKTGAGTAYNKAKKWFRYKRPKNGNK